MAAVLHGLLIFFLSQYLAAGVNSQLFGDNGLPAQIHPNRLLNSVNEQLGYLGNQRYPAVATNSFQQTLPLTAKQNVGSSVSYQSAPINSQDSSLMNAGGGQYSDLQMQQMAQAQLASDNNIKNQQDSQFQIQSNNGQQFPSVDLQLMQQAQSGMNALETNYNQIQSQFDINSQPSLQWQTNENLSLNPKTNANQQFSQQGNINLSDTQQFPTQLEGSNDVQYGIQNQAGLQKVGFQQNYPSGLKGTGLQQVIQSGFDLSDMPRKQLASVNGEQGFLTAGVNLLTPVNGEQEFLTDGVPLSTLVAGEQLGHNQQMTPNYGQKQKIQMPQNQFNVLSGINGQPDNQYRQNIPNEQLEGHKINSYGILMANPNDIHVTGNVDKNEILKSSNVKVDLQNLPEGGTSYSLPTKVGESSNFDLNGNQNYQAAQNPKYGSNQYQQQPGKKPTNGFSPYQQAGQNTNYGLNLNHQQTNQNPNYALDWSQQIPNKNNNYMETQIERPPMSPPDMSPTFLGNSQNNLNPVMMNFVLSRISRIIKCNMVGLQKMFNIVKSNFPNSQLSDQMQLLLTVGQSINTGLQNAMRGSHSVNGQQGMMNGAPFGLGALFQTNTMSSSNGMYGNSQLGNGFMGGSTPSNVHNFRVGTSARELSQDNNYSNSDAEDAQKSEFVQWVVKAVNEALSQYTIPPYSSDGPEMKMFIQEITKAINDPVNKLIMVQ